MRKIIILALLFISVVGKAQKPINFQSVDSITYQCYLSGDWDKLIRIGNEAILLNIDYKRLRQRIGYACFANEDFYDAQKNYEKALTFDEYDADTRAYLYYCGLNTGNESFARFHAANLPIEVQQNLKIKPFKIIDAVDFEYNYKSNNSGTRSNPIYTRLGVNTLLDFRFTLYQSVSYYSQTFNSDTIIKQPEYYAMLSWAATSHISLNVAYHYLGMIKGGELIPANMGFASIAAKMNRFHFGINGSVLNDKLNNTSQIGVNAGVTFEGKSNVSLNSSYSQITEKSASRSVFSQSFGSWLFKSFWVEAKVTLGNLNNYNDYNALYVYNSIDPTKFRAGLTMFYYLGKRFIITANYTFDLKQININNYNYMQQSFLGGIRWKI
jgi:hypothetical protein